MSDEFGTVNVRRGERSREIEALRQQYRNHRESLARLAAEAPTEHLALEYRRLIADIDSAVAKLDELEGRPRTAPGDRPLVGTPPPPAGDPYAETVLNRPSPAPGSRVILIVLAAVVLIAIVGGLIWYASRERRKVTPTITEQPTSTVPITETTPTSTAPVTPAPTTTAPASAGLQITPAVADYGVVRKGTRAVRTFEVRNTGANPVTIQVARSACRCLFYEYKDKIPPNGKETLTVAVDGAKAKSGNLNETVQVTGKKDPSISASFGVQAVIR
jgi:hypothetical protein